MNGHGLASPVNFYVVEGETKGLVHLGGPKSNQRVDKCIGLAKPHTGALT